MNNRRNNIVLGLGLIVNSAGIMLSQFLPSVPHWVNYSLIIVGSLTILTSVFLLRKSPAKDTKK